MNALIWTGVATHIVQSFFFFILFMYFCCAGSLPGGHFFLVMKSRGYSLVAVSRFLTAVASPVEDRI